MGLNGGATTSGWVCGGPGLLTEEYNFSAQVVTAAAWASGGSLSQLELMLLLDHKMQD